MIYLNKAMSQDSNAIKLFEGIIHHNPNRVLQDIPLIKTCQLPEITLYYAAVPNDQLSDSGTQLNNECIFQTLDEADASGFKYQVASWNDINNAADYYDEFYPDQIISTPQGKFIWTEIFEEDRYTEEIEMTKCVYRPYGAPVSLCEEIEDYLSKNHCYNANLLNVDSCYIDEVEVFSATIFSEIDGMFRINSLGGFEHL
ncbi:hypothetical protein [Paenibacillus sp. FSL H3-0286]|uniref:hypothetical protein n=1 Tax=Paenibacillus sp. FSL H3-0286 TaxID=2921427 RepID=UPI0032459A64